MNKLILDNIKRTLQLHLPPKADAILYGSQARGDERLDPDWDILVTVDKDRLQPQDYDNITYPLAKLGWNITPFYHNVQKDGIYLT